MIHSRSPKKPETPKVKNRPLSLSRADPGVNGIIFKPPHRTYNKAFDFDPNEKESPVQKSREIDFFLVKKRVRDKPFTKRFKDALTMEKKGGMIIKQHLKTQDKSPSPTPIREESSKSLFIPDGIFEDSNPFTRNR